jgi:hypothetical protein
MSSFKLTVFESKINIWFIANDESIKHQKVSFIWHNIDKVFVINKFFSLCNDKLYLPKENK